MYKRHHFLLMAAMGAALTSGAGAVAQAYEPAAPVGLHAKHVITEQTCHFDTVAQLEAFLDGVADREHWTRSDKAEIPAAPLTIGSDDYAASQVDNTAAQFNALAETRPAMHVNLDLDQLRAGAAPADAITTSAVIAEAPAAAPAEPAAPAATEPAFINTGAAA